MEKEFGKHSDSLSSKIKPNRITCKMLHESSVALFTLISLHELTPIIDAYQWNARDHLK